MDKGRVGHGSPSAWIIEIIHRAKDKSIHLES